MPILARDSNGYRVEDWDTPADNTPCRCSSCCDVHRFDALMEIGDCSLTPGDGSPAGRCPDRNCDSLCYVVPLPLEADVTRALVLYQLDPGHSDLDNEQPMSVKVGGADYRCTLGDIRKAQREAYGERNAIAMLVADLSRTPSECAVEIMALCGLPLPPAVAQ